MDTETAEQQPGYGSFTHEGTTVESNTESAEQIRTALGVEAPVVDEAPVVEARAKPRNDPRARVEQATAKEAEAKRERDEAKAESAALKTRLAALESRTMPEPVKAPVAAPVAGDAEPKEEDFPDYRSYVKAQARWEAKEEIRNQENQRQTHAVQQQREHRIREVDRQFGERYTAILADEPDFASKVDPRLLNTPRTGVLTDPAQATFGSFLVEQVFQSEHPKELLLHLSNLEEVQRLATLPADQVIRELAKFEARLDAASPGGPAPVIPIVSKAKPPTQPLGSSHVSTADDGPPGDDATDDDWFKWNDRQKKAKAKRS